MFIPLSSPHILGPLVCYGLIPTFEGFPQRSSSF